MDNNEISVLMSVYYKDNPLHFIEAIESIISQTLVPREIVIIIDGEIDDNYHKIINTYQQKYKYIKVFSYAQNKGSWYALNFGVNKCSCEIIARMDSDDISAPNRLEIQLREMINTNADIIGSNTIEFESNIENIISKRIMPETHEEICRFSKKRNPFIHPSVMFKKDIVLKSGNYQDFPLFEDYYMWIKMIMNGAKCYNIQENLIFMRVSKNFYKRRGGISYIPKILHFFNYLLKEKYIKLDDYIYTLIPRLIMCIVPSSIREKFYKKKLRNNG